MSASCEQGSCKQGVTLVGDLHARPAGALAVAAGRFASAVSVTAGGHTADAKSVLGVMGLGATSGQHVTVSAAGPDAREAVASLIIILTEATKVGGLLPGPPCGYGQFCAVARDLPGYDMSASKVASAAGMSPTYSGGASV
jgi:phosphocarrier protein HPr